jgi:hypothetical protein
MKKSVILLLILCSTTRLFSQGTLSGDLMMNLNFFQRDTNIKAANNPLYDNYLSGGESWLNVRYNTNGFTFFVRADGFYNSNLKNPTSAMTDFGVGAWSISKDFKDLSLTVGSIYDQLGSGILFRAYEDRALLIDNALVGVELKYRLNDKIMLKGFTGQQKNNNQVNNSRYAPVIKGFGAEGDFSAGQVHLLPGIGILNRTLDAVSYNTTVERIKTQDSNNHFEPVYNMYAFAGYNTLVYKNFSWYIEGDYKTHEAIVENNLLVDKPGDLEYTSLSIGKKGIALSLNGKRTRDFVMRTSANEVLLDGMLNRQPVIAVQRPERLIARYTPASQDISELAGSATLNLSPNDVTNFVLSYTNINTLENTKLYREAYAEGIYQGWKSWLFQVGVQYLEYNVYVYQVALSHIEHPVLYSVTPFAEITYRVTDTKSFRAELQYMNSDQDYGSWAFALLEYNVAPRWSISVSDMYNVSINKNSDNPNYSDPGFSVKKANNYPSVYAAYTKGPHRFSLAYVKQVDGINCTGGVCRYEPAFSGVKATITTSF